MASGAQDAYRTLGVSPGASDQEVRSAYRRLVQRHHPDHNGGSMESARRFEEIQRAYAQVREQRAARPTASAAGTGTGTGTGTGSGDPHIDARLAAMEFELREAQRAREAQLRDARRARDEALRDAAGEAQERPRATDEELGYYSTADSLTQILADARSELSDRFSHAREHPIVQRVSDLIEGLDELASSVDRHRPRGRRDG